MTTNLSPMGWAAIGYAAVFGWPVFPLAGKVPAIPKQAGGNGVHDASLDERQIRAWWTRSPEANIGVPAGEPTRFWVLDIDVGKGGAESLAKLQAEHGPLPSTVEAVTGTGGQHILFAWNGDTIKNRANKLAPGLDVRANGGYIVVAPSIHPDTGRAYEWRAGHGPSEREIVAAPDWLLELVTAEPDPPPSAPRAVCPPSSWGPKPAYAQAALDRAARAIAGAPPGQQDDTLNAEAFSIGTLVGAGIMPKGFAKSVLIRAGEMMCPQPGRRPWHPSEIEKKVTRAIEDGARHPREVQL